MNPAETELWQRIAAFSFDDPTAAWPFSARLAKENRWTPDFAARATPNQNTTGLAVAVFGAAVLPALGLTDLQQIIAPVGPSSSGGDSGSSCGGGGGGGCGGCGSH